MSETVHPLPDGTRVRATGRSVSGDEDMDEGAARPGDEYTVFTHAQAGHQHNDDPLGKAYYLLDEEYSIGGSHWAYEEHVEVVMTVGQLEARKLPSIGEVSQAVSGGLHSLMNEGMEFHETSIEGEEGGWHVIAAGKTDEGLRFAARIAVLSVWESDF